MKSLFEFAELIYSDIHNSTTLEELEIIRIKCLGKKGYITLEIKKLVSLNREDKKKTGIVLNKIKSGIYQAIIDQKKKIRDDLCNVSVYKSNIDVTLPGRRLFNGHLHPITVTINFIKSFFFRLGFNSIEGPEIEDEYHNFDALNIPSDHPARAMHDTFWFDTDRLLRTQTSSMQVRIIKSQQLPIYCIVPGKVYRNDYDATHTPMFHQLEGLIIDRDVNFSNLKWMLESLLYEFFGKTINIRFRSSYFPFTVPSAEVDIKSYKGDWLEVLGCGMVHPSVLKNLNINTKLYLGCAFGIGIERMTMLRYNISDIRSFFKNDIRFLKQF
ncbi:MAG: phenylalanine--tRNA ligase subunit alpha [Buchnera aphidicola (Eriosoma harunire)]